MQNYIDFDNKSFDEYLDPRLEGKNWTAAIMLCWMFGLLGIHRFYTGYKGLGFVFILLTITIVGMPISMLWVGVDWFSMLIGTYKHADGEDLYERNQGLAVTFIILSVIALVCFLLFAIIGIAALPSMLQQPY